MSNNGKLNQDILKVEFVDSKMKVSFFGNPQHWSLAVRMASLELDNIIIGNQQTVEEKLVTIPKGIMPEGLLKKLI